MLMTLLKATGERTEAVLLAAGNRRMRVLIPGLSDTTELRFIKDQWWSENGMAVRVESLIAIDARMPDHALESGKPLRTMTAGS